LKYLGDGLEKDRHGFLYQRDIIMPALRRGMKMEGEFRLATELPEAGKLGDLYFSYHSSPEQQWSRRFLQIEHGQISEDRMIIEKDHFSPSGKYFVPKYFLSYLSIREATERPCYLYDLD
jgi:hypothetical protein